MTQQPTGLGEARDYVTYLLRLWRETGERTVQWRASLQDPQASERVGFACLEELFVYLRRETADPSERNGSDLGKKGRGA